MSDPTTTPVYCGAPSPNVERGYQVGHHLCGLMSGHDGPHHCDVCLHEWTESPSSAPSEAEAQEADCPSSEKQLEERVRVLEEALHPFTMIACKVNETGLATRTVRLSDVHRARKALSGGGSHAL